MVDDEIGVRELLARHLPGVDVAYDAAVASFGIDRGKPELVDARIDGHRIKVRERCVPASLERLELRLLAPRCDYLSLVVYHDESHRVLRGRRSRLAHVGGHHEPDLAVRFR